MSNWFKNVLQPVLDIYLKIESLLGFFAKPAWGWAKRFWQFVGPSRFSAFTVLASGGLLVSTDQGRELAARVWEDGWPSFLILVLAVEWLALQSWYWARIVLPVDDLAAREIDGKTGLADRDSKATKRWKRWTPRVYAILTFILAAVALAISGHSKSATAMFVIGAATLVILMYRHELTGKLPENVKAWTRAC